MNMHPLIAAITLLCSTLSTPLNAAEYLAPVAADTTGAVKITFKLTNAQALASNAFLSNEAIKLTFDMTVATEDIGQIATFFTVARYGNQLYMLTENGNWVAWDGQLSTLAKYKTKSIAAKESIDVLNNQMLPAGEFLVYAGYMANRGNVNSPIFYNAKPASFVVFDAKSPALHAVNDKSVLTALFERGSQAYKGQGGVSFSPDLAGAPAASDSTAVAASSQTNLQEIGVDEADRIKVDGDQLFTLESCLDDPQTRCIGAYRMIETPASSIRLGSLSLGKNTYQDAIYSVQTSIVNTRKQLVYIGSSMQQSIYASWFQPYYWGNNKTEIKFLDVTQPAAMQVKSTITLNTTLLSSRVVDNVLYVVTRKNPHFSYPAEPAKPIVLGDSASPLTPAQIDDSIQTLPYVPPKPVELPKIDIDELLPTIAFNGEKALPMVKATDCYVPAQSSDKSVDNTLMTITAVPLTAPNDYYSVCVAGSVDTFYMSTQALYLASTRYPYQMNGNTLTFDHKKAEVMTELHKFKLSKNALEYAGSGAVLGHLGWEVDKQPFRMGENNNFLKVATSRGDSWNNTSTTRVSVLQEEPATKTLKEISFLDNLGKPGERLYAARFIQNRGYLVTFKTTDPLYVLDFNDPFKPVIMGELQINGYSDYLHPIGDNYLLGIGKDAVTNVVVPNTPLGNNIVDTGTWYQGIKLSLFDVSSTEKLSTLDSVIIGKRGTESGALYDHHALAWLATGDSKGTLAIPIQLHNNLLPSSQLQYYSNAQNYYDSPSAFYDWTHTGLYTFTIDAHAKPAIKLNRRLIANVNDPLAYGAGAGTYDDRAVIQGGTVHYVHGNRVLSADISVK